MSADPGKNATRLRWLAVGAFGLAAGWTFYSRSSAPLGSPEAEARRAALHTQIADARTTIRDVQALEAKLTRERSELASLHAGVPASSALVWFPERMKRHFERSGVAEAVTRLNTTIEEPELPDFERIYWAVELPVGNSSAEVREMCLAIAELEPLDPSIRVLDTEIRPDANDPTRRLLVMNVAVLSRKVAAAP